MKVIPCNLARSGSRHCAAGDSCEMDENQTQTQRLTTPTFYMESWDCESLKIEVMNQIKTTLVRHKTGYLTRTIKCVNIRERTGPEGYMHTFASRNKTKRMNNSSTLKWI